MKNYNIYGVVKHLLSITFTILLVPASSFAATDEIVSGVIPDNSITRAQSLIIEQNLVKKNYREAIAYIDNELIKKPNNVMLLNKKSGIYIDMEQYDKAKTTINQALAIKPKDREANKLEKLVHQLSEKDKPRNEIGLNIDEAYVSDIDSYWNFASLHYYRFTKYGTYGARINYAKRYGSTAEQYQLEAYPEFPDNKYLQYIHLSIAYSNFTQFLFPNYKYVVEPYFNLPRNFEFSIGQRGLRALSQNIYTYTGSLAYYWGDNYTWFRPYHYTPKSSDFFEAGTRHYFGDKNTYISIKGGIGRAPDLLDFAPLNQIVILDQKLIAVNGQFPVAKNLFMQAGAGYIRQDFPSGTLRQITDVNVGLIWQF